MSCWSDGSTPGRLETRCRWSSTARSLSRPAWRLDDVRAAFSAGDRRCPQSRPRGTAENGTYTRVCFCHAPDVSPRALLGTGLGLLVVGLLLVPQIGDPDAMTVGPHAFVIRGYLSSACALVGAGLLVAAAAISSLTRQPRQPKADEPGIDHYS